MILSLNINNCWYYSKIANVDIMYFPGENSPGILPKGCVCLSQIKALNPVRIL